MNELEYIASVSYLLEQKPQGRLVPPEAIQASLPLALSALGREIAKSGVYALQQKEFTVAMVNGAASLSAITDLIPDTVDTVLHPDIDGEGNAGYFSRIPDGTRKDLAGYISSLSDEPPYVIEKNTIYASLGIGSYPAVDDLPSDASLTVLASAAPELSTVHGYFLDRLVELGAEISLKFSVVRKAEAV